MAKENCGGYNGNKIIGLAGIRLEFFGAGHIRWSF
jgi:hypothetical protein